jgi:kynurenine formamidase
VLRVADTGAIGRASLEAACEAANLVGALGAAGGAGRLGANGGRWLSPRVLVATGAPYDGRSFPSSAPFFEATAVDWLLGLGTRLIGIDGPSVDPLDSKTLAAHHLMFEAGGGVLENLRLEDVTAGAFTLMAAPVLVEGADAAPVRALLEVS